LMPLIHQLQIYVSQFLLFCNFHSTMVCHLKFWSQYCFDLKIFLLFFFFILHIFGFYVTLSSSSTSVSESSSWSPPTFCSQYTNICCFYLWTLDFMYLYSLNLFTLTSIGLVSNFLIVTNNIMLFGNTYCTLYDPNHFLINFPRCDLFPFGNHIKHNHQNWIVFLDSFVDSIMLYSTIEYH
jgi:hypothetical protein